MSIGGNIRKILFVTLWSVAGAGALVLLIAAINSRNNKACRGYEIHITGTPGPLFVDKKEVINALTDNGSEVLTGKSIAKFNLREMQEAVEQNPWILRTQLFFDNNEVLRVNITERQPVARIFTSGGSSFYIDSNGIQLPLAGRAVVKIPVFTSYPYDKIKTHGADSILLRDIRNLAAYIFRDSFWSAQIAQVDISPSKTFEMVPVIGNHLITFGDGSDCEKKFRRLFIFYKNVLSKTGFEKYAQVNVAYAGQIIGTKKGSGLTRADSLQALKNIQQLIRSARQLQPDTAHQDIKPLDHDVKTEQNLNYDLDPGEKDSSTNAPKSNPPVEKPKSNLPVEKPKSRPPIKKPKAVMPVKE